MNFQAVDFFKKFIKREFFMNAFINKNLLLQPIIFIDIGSRGGVQKKWLIFKDKLNVIGFEPDKEEYDRMQNEGLPMKNYNIGLW